MTDSLVSASQLHNLLSRPNDDTVVLFTSYTRAGVASKLDIVLNNPNTYIPNSIFFDLAGMFSDLNQTAPTMMLTPELMAQRLGELGIEASSDIVVYDDFGNFCASRVWFMLKVMGHEKVRVLDGGLPVWLQCDLPLSHSLTPASKKALYSFELSNQFQFVDIEFVYSTLDDSDICVLDARNYERFEGHYDSNGQKVNGHIPSSQSLHYKRLQNNDGQFLSLEQLKLIFQQWSSQSLIYSCGSGVTACILAHAAHICGIQPLKVFDGSWSQWSQPSLSMPIDVGATE